MQRLRQRTFKREKGRENATQSAPWKRSERQKKNKLWHAHGAAAGSQPLLGDGQAPELHGVWPNLRRRWGSASVAEVIRATFMFR